MKKAPVQVLRRVMRPIGVILYGLAGMMLLCAASGVLFHALGSARPGVDDGSVINMVVAAAFTAIAADHRRDFRELLSGKLVSFEGLAETGDGGERGLELVRH